MKYSVCIFFILFVGTATAQYQPRFMHFSVKDGLSQNSVHAIFRDSDGLLWTGTQDGLNSFDGKNFTVYRHDDNDITTISDQFVVAIKQDHKGFLWIGTRNGLNRFNKQTGKFERFYISQREKHSFQAAYFDFSIQNDNNVIVNRDGNLWLLDAAAKTFRRLHQTFPACAVLQNYGAVAVDTEGETLLCTDIRTGSFAKSLPAPLPVTPLEYYSVASSGDSIFYFYNSTQNIFRYNIRLRKWLKTFTVPDRVIHVNATSADSIIISSSTGIYVLSGAGNINFIQSDPANPQSLAPGNILCTYSDTEKNLWTGTAGNGFAFTNDGFNHFTLKPLPVPNDIVTSVTAKNGEIFIGSRTGLYRTAAGTQRSLEQLARGKNITAVTADIDNNIWYAVQGEGLIAANAKGKQLRSFNSGNSILPPVPVLHLSADARGNVLISTVKGFYVANVKRGLYDKFSTTAPSRKLEGDYVMGAYADSHANLWIVNNLGVNMFDSNYHALVTFNSTSDSASYIKRTIVTSVTEDKNGVIWIGTIRNGLYRYTKKSFSHYTTGAGLNSDVIYSVCCDNRNRIWVVTSAGLNVSDSQQTAFSSLTAAQGLPGLSFSFGAMQKDEKGNILIGSSEGLVICEADKIELPENIIRARIGNITINGKETGRADGGIELIPDGKLLTISFANSPAFYTGNIFFQYRLRGLSDDWITLPHGVNAVSFSGLPYRLLHFEVRAASSLNKLASAPAETFSIKSKPPIQKTPLFIGGIIFLFVVLAALAVMEYNRRKFRRQLALLKIQKGLHDERIRIGRDLHDNIGAYTSALIAGLNRIQPAGKKEAEEIDDLKSHGVNIMGFLRETIWMLNSETLTLTAFADRFKNYALRIGRQYPDTDLKFSEVIQTNGALAPTVMLNVFRILQEALQNAYRHAEAKTISISISDHAAVEFSVTDDGRGFEAELTDGGYGINNMKKRAEESGFIFTLTTGETGTVAALTANTANAALLRTPPTI